MNGKTFDVDATVRPLVQQLSAADPQALKDLAPWPDLADVEGVGDAELQSGGYGAPPYHAGCRGMLSIVEGAEEAEGAVPVSVPATAEPVETETGDELTLLQIPAEGEEAAGWDEDAIKQLGWERFDVTDPDAFKAVDDAYAAGDYDEAEELIDKWQKSLTAATKDDAQQADD